MAILRREPPIIAGTKYWLQSFQPVGTWSGRVGEAVEIRWQVELSPIGIQITTATGAAGLRFVAQWRNLVMGSPQNQNLNIYPPWLAFAEATADFVVSGGGGRGLRLTATGSARGVPPQTGAFRVGFQIFSSGNGGVINPNPLIVGTGGEASSAILTITGGGSDPDTPGGGNSSLKLSWFQARFLAMQGAKIRREGWKDRYLEYTGSLWYLQLVNAVTGVAGTRAVVQAGDWTVEHFRAADWTSDDIDAALLTAASTIATVFP